MGSEELDEKNFIQEHGPKFIWVFLVLFLVVVALLWGINLWQRNLEQKRKANSPFYQVTNREFSLFLWQNPSFMRAHSNLSEAYLPHFRSKDEIHLIPEFAEEYVAAPPDILYRYHVWKRLLWGNVRSQLISQGLFSTFLKENPEWRPELWPAAPADYRKLVNKREETFSSQDLPMEVQMAFQGWVNVTREWEAINTLHPKKEELSQFLESHPHYAQNYWRNLIPGYLKEEFPFFLKSAFFNSQQ